MNQTNTKPASPLLLTAAFFMLLFLTAVSFHFGRIHYEAYDIYFPLPVYLSHLDDLIVLAVAFLQVVIVIFVFMRLSHDRIVNTFFILGSTLIIFVFCIFLLTDRFYRGTADKIEDVRLKTPVEIGK